MLKDIFKAVYQLLEAEDRNLVLNVGDIELGLHLPKEDLNWSEIGITANGRVYTPASCLIFGCEAPKTLAQLFSGEYNIIEALSQHIYTDWVK